MKKREINIDIIRVIAITFVIFVHFLLNIGFYNNSIVSKRMMFLNVARVILITCVPLFLLITGYLMNEKKISKNYYKSLGKIIGLYLIISLECFLFSKYYLGNDLPFSQLIFGMFNFTNDPYSWYVKMYIGLYLMIPIFNIIIKGLDKKNFQIVLLTFIALTVLPTAVNIYNLTSLGEFVNTNVNSITNVILNDYWLALWPITYYFTGAYLKKFPIEIKFSKIICLILSSVLFFSVFNINRNYGFNFSESLYVQYFGFQAYILSILIFCCIQNTKLKKENSIFSKIILFISKYSFGMYLTSWMVDVIIYKWLNDKFLDINLKIPYFFVVPIIVFIISLLLSFISSKIQEVLMAIFKKLKKLLVKIYISIKKLLNNIRTYKYTSIFLIGIILLGYLLLGIYKTRYGTGSTDEAFYLTIPLRMNMGDILIINEWHLSQLVGFITYPIMKIFLLFNNTDGIILNFRIIFIIFKVITALILYRNIKNYDKWGAILSTSMYLLYTPYNITQFSYNSIGLISVILFSVLYFNDCSNKLKNILAGVFYAFSVLCCPFLALLMIYFIIKFIYSCIKKDKENIIKILYFVIGIFIIFISFVIYLLSQTKINNIIETIPYLFKDPEHSGSNVISTILLLLSTFTNYMRIISYCFWGLIVIIFIDFIFNKKIIFKNLYLGTIIISCLIQILSLGSMVNINYNFIMIPLACVDIIMLWIMFLESKIHAKASNLMKIGLISILYGICLITSSNQLLYAFSTGMSIMTIMTPLIFNEYIKKYFVDDNIVKIILVSATGLLLFIQIGTQFKSVYTHVFPMNYTDDMKNKLEEGPLAGILVTENEYLAYNSINNDLKEIKKLSPNNFLCYNCLPYTYLYLEFPMATQSAWSGSLKYQLEIEKDYQKLNKTKIPYYIYISKYDLSEELNIKFLKDYSKKTLSNGYLFVKKEGKN